MGYRAVVIKGRKESGSPNLLGLFIACHETEKEKPLRKRLDKRTRLHKENQKLLTVVTENNFAHI